MKLVVGLGNPGAEYAHTRHNAGFATVDVLAGRLGVTTWTRQADALVAVAQRDGRELVLAKPQSF
ncbi:MAG: aminoacyl-tRNA hydrolase, partial [Atopobiaceae bacterium]|nr:aminoacyl-tRNA hydrolase [Atopobiaceae bacterium]